jgi:glucuronosyltransferase
VDATNGHFMWVACREALHFIYTYFLGHPSVKLFISHGGLLGGQEAVYCGIPRIGIPLFADQNKNILLAEEMGIAVKVSYNDISKETILSAVGRILKDTT